jgi:hypothetical protein
MRRVQLTLAIATLPVIIAVLAGLAIYTGLWASQDSSADPWSPSAQETVELMDQAETARQFFEAFPTKSYTSFEEAEQVAGYHIPRPSDEYPLAFGLTHLTWFPQFERPLSETLYVCPPLDPLDPNPTSFIVIVAPSYFSSLGDEGRMSGQATTVGGKTGWAKPTDISFVFNYLCGEIDGYNVWCSVSAPKEVGWEAFEQFVSTLE